MSLNRNYYLEGSFPAIVRDTLAKGTRNLLLNVSGALATVSAVFKILK